MKFLKYIAIFLCSLIIGTATYFSINAAPAVSDSSIVLVENTEVISTLKTVAIKKAAEENVISLTITGLSNKDSNEFKENASIIISATIEGRTDIIFKWTVAEGSDIINIITISNSVVQISATGGTGTSVIKCQSFLSTDTSYTTVISEKIASVNIVKKDSTASEIISSILDNKTVIIFIIGIAATILCRTAVKIFRMGAQYRTNFATVAQQEKFQDSIREEIRNSKNEIQDSLLKICLREINREMKPLNDLQKLSEDLATSKEILDVKLNNIEDKYNEIKHITENVNVLEKKVNNLQYGDATSEIRRSGK